jgi:hypothetical protein
MRRLSSLLPLITLPFLSLLASPEVATSQTVVTGVLGGMNYAALPDNEFSLS